MNASVVRVEFARQVVRPSRAGMGQGSQRNETNAWSAQDQEHSAGVSLGPQVSSRTLYRSQGHQAPQPCRPGLLLEIIDFDIAMQVKDEDEDEEVDDQCGTKR